MNVDTVVSKLNVPQQPYTPYRSGKTASESACDFCLAEIVELTRQNLATLEQMKSYTLLSDLKVPTELSLIACILRSLDTTFGSLDYADQIKKVSEFGSEFDPNLVAKKIGINIIIWSNKLKLYQAGESIDHPTLIIFQNKYGQYYSIVKKNCSTNIHLLHDSPLLLKLLNSLQKND